MNDVLSRRRALIGGPQHLQADLISRAGAERVEDARQVCGQRLGVVRETAIISIIQ